MSLLTITSKTHQNPLGNLSSIMAAPLVRSRLLHLLAKRSGGRALSVSSVPPKEPISSIDPTFSDQAPSPPPPPSSADAPARRSRSVLMFGSLAAISAAIGTTSYVSYAYTLDEVEHKANALREKIKVPASDDSFQNYKNLANSTVMKVPVKIIDVYLDARRAIEDQVRGFTEPSSEKLLPDLHPQEQHVFTLVLDLNETLVYSDWKRDRGWRTFKRPGVDAFLEHLAKFYEIVVYSDQLSMYVDPVIERLDQKGCIRYRLSRAATKYVNGKHYRDLSKLNRDPSRIIYISGHALESSLQPENCIPIKPWKLENDDTALLDLIPFLEYVALHRPADIRPVLSSYQGRDIAREFIERSKEHQRKMQEQKQQSRFWRR